MKLLFIHIPKNAGGSIKHWLRNKTFESFSHHTLQTILNREKIEYDKSFCVVRNTYENWISRWRFANATAKRRLIKNPLDKSSIKSLEITDKGIEYWIDWYHNGNGPWPISQLEYIKNVDIILNFESINTDFKLIQNLYNSTEPLQKNIHVSTPFDKSKIYTKKFKQSVERYYAKEIDYFNYLPVDK